MPRRTQVMPEQPLSNYTDVHESLQHSAYSSGRSFDDSYTASARTVKTDTQEAPVGSDIQRPNSAVAVNEPSPPSLPVITILSPMIPPSRKASPGLEPNLSSDQRAASAVALQTPLAPTPHHLPHLASQQQVADGSLRFPPISTPTGPAPWSGTVATATAPGVAQGYKRPPTSVPVTPQSATSTSYGNDIVQFHGFESDSIPSAFGQGPIRPDSTITRVETEPNIARQTTQNHASTLNGPALTSTSASASRPDVVHVQQAAGRGSGSQGPTTQADVVRGIYYQMFGREPDARELTWLCDPARRSLPFAPTVPFQPTVILTPNTPGSDSSSATSAQYVLANEGSEDSHVSSSDIQDPFHKDPPPSDFTQWPYNLNLKSRFSSDSDVPRFASHGAVHGYGEDESEGDDETDRLGALSEDAEDAESGTEGDEVDESHQLRNDGDYGYAIPSTPPPRPIPSGHQAVHRPAPDPAMSPSKRVEERVWEAAYSAIQVDPEAKKSKFGILLGFIGKGDKEEKAKAKAKGKEKEREQAQEKAGITKKLEALSKGSLLPPLIGKTPSPSHSGSPSPRTGSPAATMGGATPRAPSPAHYPSGHRSDLPLSTSRSATVPDPKSSGGLHSASLSTGLSARDYLHGLRTSRSEANLGSHYANAAGGTSGGPRRPGGIGDGRFGGLVEPTQGDDDDDDYDPVSDPDFWFLAPFLASFLTFPSTPRSVLVPNCDGSPLGHHSFDGTKTCPCPLYDRVTVEPVFDTSAKIDLERRQRLLAACLAKHTLVNGRSATARGRGRVQQSVRKGGYF